MKPQIHRVEPNSDYDLNGTDGEIHQYLVDFLLDCLNVWVKTSERDGIYEAEKFRCERAKKKVSMLLKKITTSPSHKLRMCWGIIFGDRVKFAEASVEY